MPRQVRTSPALDGYRALDLTDEKGFLCGKILAEMGVDVIKVEPPGGDPSRNAGPFYHDEPDPEKSLPWWAYNTGKRGITLDLTAKEGRETFLDLVKGSDFVIESFTPGHLADLGLSYEELASANPGVILVSISAFGQDGPYARYKAPDLVVMALSGYMNLLGEMDRPPLRFTVPQAYCHAASEAATGALIALWHREATGRGQWVDVSAQECMAWETFNNHIFWDFKRVNPTRGDAGNSNLSIAVPPAIVMFACKDGYVLYTPTFGKQGAKTREFVEWAVGEGASPTLLDVAWESNVFLDPTATQEEKQAHHARIQQARLDLAAFLLTKTRKELFDYALANNLPLAPLNRVGEVPQDAHFRARELWTAVEHPEVGETIVCPGHPVVMVDHPYRIWRRAPLIGEHNAEILTPGARPALERCPAGGPRAAEETEVFKGLKVLDLTWVTVGPRACRYFADHGATIVKIEAPERPDIGRSVAPFKDEITEPDRSAWFAMYNVNKLGTAIDLTHPRGKDLAKRLIRWADVLIESYRPGVMKKLGLDYESVKYLNPRLIYASTSQLGQTGPNRFFGGYGHHAAAMTGFDDIVGWPDRPPVGAFWAYTDHIAPQFLVGAIVAALLRREETGRGQYIEQSQNEAALQFLAPAFIDNLVNGREISRNGTRDPYAAPHGAYRCQGEDRWCAIAVFTDEEWQAFCRVSGQRALGGDPRFATLAARKANEDDLDALVSEWTSRLTPEVAMDRLQRAGVPAGMLSRAEDMHCDPQFRLRRHYLTFEHSVMGPHDVDALPFRLSRTPARQYLPAPCVGEHNGYVCTEILGLSDEAFVSLMEAGVFG